MKRLRSDIPSLTFLFLPMPSRLVFANVSVSVSFFLDDYTKATRQFPLNLVEGVAQAIEENITFWGR